MTLRARLLLGYAIVLAMIVAGAVAVVRIQEAHLVELVDRQIQNAMGPIMRGPAPAPPDRGAGPSDQVVAREPDAPISDLYLAVLIEGRLQPLVVGQLLDDRPAIGAEDAAAALASGASSFTVDGERGVNRFRVLVTAPAGGSDPAVVALPMTAVDDAVKQLTLTLIVGVAVIAAVLGLIVFWVEMLGVRPIRRLTVTADAIAAGDREQRAIDPGERTEAAHLARAFNLMLDERDHGEERLRRFVSDASHELRTPLTSLRGYLDLLREGGETAEERIDMLRRMAAESARMGDLVEDLLLLARLDEHRPLRREQVDLRTVLEDAARDARVLQPDRPVTVAVAGEGPLLVTGDAHRLEQVIGALVDNALSHTDAAAGLRLEARATATGDTAEVVVADAGPGLDADTAGRVFDRFVRGDASRSRRSGGAGLGLSIAKAVVDAHGGAIRLDTAPGAGCRLTITLPRTAEADPPVGPGT